MPYHMNGLQFQNIYVDVLSKRFHPEDLCLVWAIVIVNIC